MIGLFVCLSVLHITVSLLRLYFDLCLFSCLFTLIVVFVIYCFVLPIVANKDLHMELPFWGERGGRRGSAMAPFERAMVISYRLFIVTVALSVTIRPQFAIECLRRSNQQGVGDFGPKFRGIPLAAGPSCCGCKERTSQAN